MDEELLELLATCVQARISREEAWKDIPKNCPFYEMAPEKYDHYEACRQVETAFALQVVTVLLRRRDAYLVDAPTGEEVQNDGQGA